MIRRLLVAAALIPAAGISLAAHVVVPTEFREVVADSGLIVRGMVTDVRTVRLSGGSVESFATVAVDAVLKGDAVRFVTVRVPGGQIGTRRFVMVGAPTLSAGQQAVFFLRRAGDGSWRPVGLSMGVYRLRADRATGGAVVAPPAVAGWTASAGPVVRGDTRRQTISVQEFESMVRLIATGRAVPSRMPLVERPVK